MFASGGARLKLWYTLHLTFAHVTKYLLWLCSTNGIVRGTENVVVNVKDGFNSVAKFTSGAVLICPADQQPRRGIRAAFKEQVGTVARSFQGAVTDVTTQT